MTERSAPPAGALTALLDEEARVVLRLAEVCEGWRAALAAGAPQPEGAAINAIDTLCMRFSAQEGEVARLLEAHGWSRGDLSGALSASGDAAGVRAQASLLAAVRQLNRVNLINGCLLDRWAELNTGLFHAILAAVSPTYVPSAAPSLPKGARLSLEA